MLFTIAIANYSLRGNYLRVYLSLLYVVALHFPYRSVGIVYYAS
jgi:hypothetical protein